MLQIKVLVIWTHLHAREHTNEQQVSAEHTLSLQRRYAGLCFHSISNPLNCASVGLSSCSCEGSVLRLKSSW